MEFLRRHACTFAVDKVLSAAKNIKSQEWITLKLADAISSIETTRKYLIEELNLKKKGCQIVNNFRW